MLENERFYSTILSLKVGDQTQAAILKDVQRHPVQERDRAHRLSAGRGEREDPHQHSAALQGRGGFAGRQDPGRHRVAHAQRGRSVAACRRICRNSSRSTSPGLSLNESIHLSQLKIPGGRAAARSRQGRRGGGGDPQPACGGAGATAAAAAAATAEGAAAAPAAARRRRRPAAMRRRRPSRKGRCQEGTGEERRQEVSFVRSALRWRAVSRWRPFALLTARGVGAIHDGWITVAHHRRPRQSRARSIR